MDGWVTLEGQVDWNYQRQAAEQAVESLMDVQPEAGLLVPALAQ